MVNAINISDVAQKMIPQALSLGSAFDNTCNINNLKDCCHLRFRLEHLAELYKPIIRNRHHCFVGLNCAERIVLGWHIQVGEHVVGS